MESDCSFVDSRVVVDQHSIQVQRTVNVNGTASTSAALIVPGQNCIGQIQSAGCLNVYPAATATVAALNRDSRYGGRTVPANMKHAMQTVAVNDRGARSATDDDHSVVDIQVAIDSVVVPGSPIQNIGPGRQDDLVRSAVVRLVCGDDRFPQGNQSVGPSVGQQQWYGRRVAVHHVARRVDDHRAPHVLDRYADRL